MEQIPTVRLMVVWSINQTIYQAYKVINKQHSWFSHVPVKHKVILKSTCFQSQQCCFLQNVSLKVAVVWSSLKNTAHLLHFNLFYKYWFANGHAEKILIHFCDPDFKRGEMCSLTSEYSRKSKVKKSSEKVLSVCNTHNGNSYWKPCETSLYKYHLMNKGRWKVLG